MHHVDVADPDSPQAQALLARLSETLHQITGSSGTASFDIEDVKVDGACFVIARSASGVAVGCGALRPLEPGIAELKRMFAVPGTKGVGSTVLAFLEQKASEFGYTQLWLETRKVNQNALVFYERHGYSHIANFGRYIGKPEAICLGKRLLATKRPP
jgi:GNAT superfamily N-acetyltransferase